MRKTLIILPFLIAATPAVAQRAPQLPPELTDPATAARVTNAMQVLSQALLNVKVGGIEAALQGREPTVEEKSVTVGDLARRDDPDFDRHLHQRMANVGPQLQRGMQAINQALPAMMQGVAEAKKSLERAVANMPDPTYPKR